jgi:hypothetical protein
MDVPYLVVVVEDPAGAYPHLEASLEVPGQKAYLGLFDLD